MKLRAMLQFEERQRKLDSACPKAGCNNLFPPLIMASRHSFVKIFFIPVAFTVTIRCWTAFCCIYFFNWHLMLSSIHVYYKRLKIDGSGIHWILEGHAFGHSEEGQRCRRSPLDAASRPECQNVPQTHFSMSAVHHRSCQWAEAKHFT